MVTTPSLRQIFSDKESLREYGEGRVPTWADISRRLFLCERSLDTRLPDHYYKRGQEAAMGEITSLPALLSTGLYALGKTHLELADNRVHVQADAWPAWQELLTFCPPLPLICGYIWKEKFRPGTRNPVELADFARQWLEPNTRYTCLLSPHYPHMHKLLRDCGLYDLHMHLTGSTETDTAWQSYLQNPFAFYRELKKVEHKEKVREQLEQEIPGFAGSLIFYEWLTTAQILRRAFIHLLFKGAYTPEFADIVDILNTPALLHRRNIAGQMIPPSLIHPMRHVFRTAPDDKGNWSDVTLEGLMYMLLMDQLDRTKDDKLAACFHYYLLILGFINRFLVQQVHQNGFDQFQKITLNDFRNKPEKEYSRRFAQLHGNDGQNLTLLEGRFAPKSTALETIRLLTQIDKGWKKFRKKYQGNQRHSPAPQLRLVCHFIKEKDSKDKDKEIKERLPVCAIRHRTLRIANMRKAQALVTARESYPGMKELVTGVDAASNELEAPPEVFAPVYRYLRRKGFQHFTYHAGEDFHHLIGGLRAMYEAVEFLGLRRGDRIGHGTAAGIDPQLWLDHVGNTLVMSKGEWLDDLLFVIYFLEQHPSSYLCTAKLSAVRAEAVSLSQQIYCKHFSLHLHIQAWLMRRYCPFHFLHELDDAMRQPTWCAEEWRLAKRDECDREALEILALYHRADCRQKYHKKMDVETTRRFTVVELMTLQETLLAVLHRREIVLETLPTSNVRISFYKNHAEHHLWRWLGVNKDKREFSNFPPVVVGTDDTGIFSTNIYNEYNHIYHHLIQTHEMKYPEAVATIEALMENARVYGFVV
jgi:adenosine deaminase